MQIKLNRALTKLIDNKTSGSNELLFSLHKHIKKELKLFQLFPILILELKQKFSPFENIQKYLDDLQVALKKENELEKFINLYDEILLNIYDNIYSKCKNILINYSNFITISNSTTVFEILKRLKKDKSYIKVYVSESRPKYEGRILAQKLAKEKIKVQLITEAMLSEYVKNSDVAIIGADSILKNGNVINKVGSNVLAILCKYYKTPFYVLADKNKISNNNFYDKKLMPSNEIWKQNYSIKITNYYFEEINKKLITKIFTA